MRKWHANQVCSLVFLRSGKGYWSGFSRVLVEFKSGFEFGGIYVRFQSGLFRVLVGFWSGLRRVFGRVYDGFSSGLWVVFSVPLPLPLPLLQREVDFEVREEYGVERLGLYICLYGRNTMQSQSLPSNLFFCLPKSTLSKSGSGSGSGTLNTTVRYWSSDQCQN